MVHCSCSAMDGYTAINFVKHVKIGFVQVGVVCAVHGSFHNRATLMDPHCFVYYDKTWMKTVLTCFTKMIAEQPSLTQYERPMYHMKEKQICYHPLITISWFVFLILRDLVLNLDFLLSFFYSHCLWKKYIFNLSFFLSHSNHTMKII